MELGLMFQKIAEIRIATGSGRRKTAVGLWWLIKKLDGWREFFADSYQGGLMEVRIRR